MEQLLRLELHSVRHPGGDIPWGVWVTQSKVLSMLHAADVPSDLTPCQASVMPREMRINPSHLRNAIDRTLTAPACKQIWREGWKHAANYLQRFQELFFSYNICSPKSYIKAQTLIYLEICPLKKSVSLKKHQYYKTNHFPFTFVPILF